MSSSALALKPAMINLSVKYNNTDIDYQFQKDVISIGRGEDCDICLTKDARSSRQHAEIKWNGTSFELYNISQKNLLYLNKQLVQKALLKNQDLINVGDSEIKVLIQEAAIFQPLIKPQLIPEKKNFDNALNMDKSAVSKGQWIDKNKEQKKTYQRPMPTFKKESNPVVIVLIVLLVVFIGYSIFKPDSKINKLNLRSQVDIIKDIEKSEKALQELEQKQENTGKNTVQYKMAQEHYIKGFRDYRQGQYSRAIQSFQASLSFYPQHQLSLKYLNSSKRKFDELIDFNLMQGHKYLSKNNFRLCKSSFANVMIMVKDPLDQKYKEAKQFYNECSAKLEDKY